MKKLSIGLCAVLVVVTTVLGPCHVAFAGKGSNGGGKGDTGGGGEDPPVTEPPINYELTILGRLPGDFSSRALDINNRGDVVGWSRMVDGSYRAFLLEPLDTDNDGVGDVWFVDSNNDSQNDLLVDLNTLVAGQTNLILMHACAINNSGQITGWGRPNGIGESRGFCYSPGRIENGETVPASLSELITPTGVRDLGGIDIHDSGDILVDGWDLLDDSIRTFIFVAGDGSNLAELPQVINARYYRVNDSLQAVGDDNRRDTRSTKAIRYNAVDDSLDVLGVISQGNESDSYSIGKDVNELGWVAGYSTFAQSKRGNDYHAFRYKNGVMEDLGTLGGSRSSAYRINLFGDVVGEAKDSTNVSHAFLYTDADNNSDGNPDGMLKLNDLLPTPFPGFLTTTGGISDTGFIAGSTQPNDPALADEAYVLVPVTP